ncbi:DUF4249 domain-containing protein [Pontibacter diazotrophicus]|uniref:DUF4249 domain-containing protein n=1 Tax=Pontibacter diazotrophicus TaxID=1400979 RepID=UPI0015F17551|nr:DUF4249 domain-containing protein [Pontibacter diazotrophicus]
MEPYAPEVIEGPNHYLVVDGLINGNGITTVKLSRTQNISEESMPMAEMGATLLLEEEQGAQYPLYETDPAMYVSNSLNLDHTKKYRLYIRLSTGREYVSDFVDVKQTPPIEKVSWEALDNSLQIYVSSRDPQNNTQYYRWEYEDTWAYTAALYSNIKYDEATGTIVARGRGDENIYNCWRSDSSKDIKLGTSAKLSQDVIHEYPILTLRALSEELRIKYSILVKQYALTQEAYQYWEALRKNTEGIGTLFDPLPAQLTGNVHSLANPDEPVIGYVGASSVQEKRIFVSRDELPKEWRYFYPTCQMDSLLPAEGETLADLAVRFKGGNYMPVTEIYPPQGGIAPIGYMGATKRCVDCRTRGTNVKPDFWE